MASARILIAHADREVRNLHASVFRDGGHEVTLAATPAEALQRARSTPHDLVLIDLVAPSNDGIALLEGIKRGCPGTLVVIVADVATVETVLTAFRRGAWDVLIRPVDRMGLLKLAERAVVVREMGERRRRMAEDLEIERLRVLELESKVDAATSTRERFVEPVGRSPRTLRDLEREQIVEVLRETRGNKKRAAILLGIHRSTLYAKLERYGIRDADAAESRPSASEEPVAVGSDG